MELSNAFTWTVINRVLTFGAMVAGIGLVILGFVLGFWGAIELLIDDPLNPSPAMDEANAVLTLVFVVAGFLVWQIGKTYALFRTLPRASGRAAARRFDYERAKSEVLEGLDERLTVIEEDLEETRRSVHELKRAEHAAAFDFEESETDLDASKSTSTEATSADAALPNESTERTTATADEEEPTSPASGVTESADTNAGTGDDGRENDQEFTFGEPTETTTEVEADGEDDEADAENDRSDADRRSTGDDPLA